MEVTEITHEQPAKPPDRSWRVMVDGLILKPEVAGIQTYIREMIRALAAQPGMEVVVVTSYPSSLTGLPVEIVRAPVATRRWVARAAWRELRLSGLVASHHADVLIAPVPELAVGRRVPAPTIVVVHDVSQVIAPAMYGRPRWLRYSASLPPISSRATVVVCVSKTTQIGLHLITGIEPPRCQVIGEGPQLIGSEEPLTVKVRRPFLLYVGTLWKHKNVATLLRALAEVKNVDIGLEMAGPASGSELSSIRADSRRLRIERRVRHHGFLPLPQLAALYRTADAVACPSLIEGFGLPLLEGMAAGVPVIASDIPAHREVGRDAPYFVTDALNSQAWADAIDQVLDDASLGKELVARGHRRAAAYSWEEVGRAFAKLIRKLSGASDPASPP